jgi:hypothetical protein
MIEPFKDSRQHPTGTPFPSSVSAVPGRAAALHGISPLLHPRPCIWKSTGLRFLWVPGTGYPSRLVGVSRVFLNMGRDVTSESRFLFESLTMV